MSDFMAYLGAEYGSPETHTKTILDLMKDLGATKLEASYDGGNDEGGVQGIRLMNDAGEIPLTSEVDRWDSPLWETCDRLLSTKFYSWAGDFHAYGTLHVDAKEKHAWTEGQMQTYEADGDTIDVQL